MSLAVSDWIPETTKPLLHTQFGLEARVGIGPTATFRKALKTNALALDSPDRLREFRQTIKLKLTLIVLTELNSFTTSLLALLLALFVRHERICV